MVTSMFLSGLAIALYSGWILTLVIVAYLPFLILICTKNILIKTETAKQELEVYNQSDAKFQESMGALKMVKQMNAETFEMSTQERIL